MEIYVDPEKPTILIMTDSAVQHSGLAQVTRNVFKQIHETEKYNLVQIGWCHNTPKEQVPWPIIPTLLNNGIPDPEDHYGQKSLWSLVPKLKPAITWVMADPFNINWLADHPSRELTKIIPYVCVDSHPMHKSWEKLFIGSDAAVVFSEFGRKGVMSAYGIDPVVIPHGVDHKIYKPAAKDEKQKIREDLFGPHSDKIIVGTVGRNMHRKNIVLMIPITRALIKGEYIICKHCKRMHLWRFDPLLKAGIPDYLCPSCGTENDRGEPVPEMIWYYYGALQEQLGWNLHELVNLYGIKDAFLCHKELIPTMGKPEQHMYNVYNSMDLFAMPTMCEGWGLPIMEAMACKIPVVLPRNSAYLDFVDDQCGGLCEYEPSIELAFGLHRAHVQLDDFASKIYMLVKDKDYRKICGEHAYERTLPYTWTKIAEQWMDLFDSILGRKTRGSWVEGEVI